MFELLRLEARKDPGIEKVSMGLAASGGRIMRDVETYERKIKVSLRVTMEEESLSREITFTWHSQEDLIFVVGSPSDRSLQQREQFQKDFFDTQVTD